MKSRHTCLLFQARVSFMAKNMTAREIYAGNVRRLLGSGQQKKVQ